MCSNRQLVAVFAYLIVEAALGNLAKRGRIPFGSLIGLVVYIGLIAIVAVFKKEKK